MSDSVKNADRLKEILGQREKDILSPRACFSHSAQRRRNEKFAKDEYRQPFSADADRILNSLAFTRYIDKTQVFSLIKNDHLTHRVLHVQLVSRVARTIGRHLGLNEDLIEAASLGHDIGHVPFGHDGERFLSKLTQANGAGHFHHNLQSIQFLDKIERKGSGWNLTLQTMDAIICHNGEIHSDHLTPEPARTFEDLDQIIHAMTYSRAKDIMPMTFEGCVVRMADTISYIGRDLEDAIRLGLVKREKIPSNCKHTLGQTNGTIVFNLVTDLISNSIDQPFIGFSRTVSEALKELKAFNYRHIYKNPVIKKHLTSIGDIFNYLFHTYLASLEKQDKTSVIFTEFLNGMSNNYQKYHSPAQIVRDFISGMTDSYFIRQAPEHMRPDAVENV